MLVSTVGAAGQPTQHILPSVLPFHCECSGRRTSVAFPTGLILTHSFDSVSNRLATLDPDGGRTTWSYDGQNRVIGIVNSFAEHTTIAWDALDREQHKTLANSMTVSLTFEAAGRETLLENRKVNGTGLAIQFNAADDLTLSVPTSGAPTTGTFDANGNLTRKVTRSTRTTYSWDGSDYLMEKS